MNWDIFLGTLIHYEGKLRLLEAAQVPKEHEEDFKSVKKFNVFNTNNLWISLPAIQRVLGENTLDMAWRSSSAPSSSQGE